MSRQSLKSLMLGVALCAVSGSAFAYTSGGSTTVTSGSNYQANSAYAQGVASQPVGYQYVAPSTNMPMATPPAPAEAVVTTPTPVVAQDDSAYDSGYTGSMGPNVQKAFEPPQPPVNPNQAAMRASANGVISNPQQIGSCLCIEAQYKALDNQVTAKKSVYTQAVSQRAGLDAQLAAGKAAPASPDQVNMIRQVSEKRIDLQKQINDQYIPDLQTATRQYNDVVAQYQQSCAGKSFDTEITARLQSNLQCRGG